MTYDVAVVGGGLVGAACADALAGEGMRVCLLEAGPFMREASWAGAGILQPIHPWSYPEPLQPLLLRAVEEYGAFVDDLEGRTGVDVELERSGVLVMDEEVDRLAEWCGDRIAHRRVEAAELDPSLRTHGPALLLPDGRHVRNHRLGRALLSSARERGADLFDFRPVTELRPGGVETPRGAVEADRTILCAGAWAARLRAGLDVEPVRGQILLYRGRVRHTVIFPDQTYVIPRRDGLLLFGSTVERAGFAGWPTEGACAHLAERATEHLGLEPGAQLAAWAGLRPGTGTLLPYIGEDPGRPDLIHCHGHFRNGILLAPLTARLVADLVAGRDPGVDLAPFAPPA